MPGPRSALRLDVSADAAWRVDGLARLLDLDATEIAQLAIGALRDVESESDVPDRSGGVGARPAAIRAGQDAQPSRQREEGRCDRDPAGNTQTCGPPNRNLQRMLWLLERRRANEVSERTHILCETGALAAATKVPGKKDPLEVR